MSHELELLEAKQRQRWRLMWLSALQVFADSTVHGSKWANPDDKDRQFLYDESMGCYFDYCELEHDEAYDRLIARGHLTFAEVSAVSEFHSTAIGYRSPVDDDYDVDAILNDPAWHNVVSAAKRAQARLLPLLKDASEVAALTKP